MGAMIHFTGHKSGAKGETWSKAFRDEWMAIYGDGVKGDILSSKDLDKKLTKKASAIKKNKARKEKVELVKKTVKKKKPVEIVINKEIKPIIQKWIRKNLRSFVKKVVVEEFKVISKAAFKQNSANK